MGWLELGGFVVRGERDWAEGFGLSVDEVERDEPH